MSIKSRLQKNRDSKAFGFSHEDTECDLPAFFLQHDELESITVYSHDKIFGEQNGFSSQLFIAFPSAQAYFAEVKRIIKLYDISSDNPHIAINLQNNVFIDIYMPPLCALEPLIFFSRKKNREISDIFKNKIISTEIIDYFRDCLEKKANIFIIGNASVDKSQIVNILANLQTNDKKIIFCDTEGNSVINKPYSINFSKQILRKTLNFPYDNIFCTEADNEDLINIFKLILSGTCGFVVSLSLKDRIDILSAIRNLILLSNTNLFEENADFMTVSSMDVVVSVEKTDEGYSRITKISEMSNNKIGETVLKDIFVWNKNAEIHISTGKESKYFNLENSKNFSPEYCEEFYQHNYPEDKFTVHKSNTCTENENKNSKVGIDKSFEIDYSTCQINPLQKTDTVIESAASKTEEKITSPKTKLEKLKEKIKQFKSERLKQKSLLEKENGKLQPTENITLDIKNSQNNTQNTPALPEKQESQESTFIPSAAENIDFVDDYTVSESKNTVINTDIEEVSDGFEKTAIINETEDNFNIDNEIQETSVSAVKSTDISNIIVEENEDNTNIELIDDEAILGVEEEYSGRIDVEQIDLVDSETQEDSNQGLLASESDDFSDEYTVPQKKIRNILEETDDENVEEIKINSAAETVQNNNSDNETDNSDFSIFTEKYEEEYTTEEKHKEPELFEEIKDIDIDNYDVADIPDEDI